MTEEQFMERREELELINPSHPLMPQIRKGYSPMAVRYLEKALETVDLEDVETAKEEDDEPVDIDKEIRRMGAKRGALFNERAKWSNKFHACESDEERADVSRKIESIQTRIKRVLIDIDYMEKNRKMPQKRDREEFPIPKSGAGIERQLQRVRNKISYQRRKIKEEKGQDGKEYKIREREEKLNQLEGYKHELEEART